MDCIKILYYICFRKKQIVKVIAVRATIITGILLIGILFGIQVQAHGQSRGSVRYTIVVTEDMLANQRAGGFEEAVDMPSASVSVQLRGQETSSYATFEADMNAAQSAEIAQVLQGHIDQAPDGEFTPEVAEETFRQEPGQYLVVMEFN